MNWHKLAEEHGETKRDHFSDPYEYVRYLERTGQSSEARGLEKRLDKRRGNENNTGKMG